MPERVAWFLLGNLEANIGHQELGVVFVQLKYKAEITVKPITITASLVLAN
jgi:hypothetical protein